MKTLKSIVVLIDADNTQLSKLESVLQEISSYGRIVVKRVYGNWEKESLKNWKDTIKDLAIKAEQQYDYVSGKNATDMALVIDALDLLYSGLYDGFALISSDSDFTPLAIKLHESGKYIIGVGEKKTPGPFRNACDEFIFIENLDSSAVEKNNNSDNESKDKKKSNKKNEDDISYAHSLLRKAWDSSSEDTGYVLGAVAGTYIKRVKPDFDFRTYGSKKLSDFLEKYPQKYEVIIITKHGSDKHIAYKCLD